MRKAWFSVLFAVLACAPAHAQGDPTCYNQCAQLVHMEYAQCKASGPCMNFHLNEALNMCQQNCWHGPGEGHERPDSPERPDRRGPGGTPPLTPSVDPKVDPPVDPKVEEMCPAVAAAAAGVAKAYESFEAWARAFKANPDKVLNAAESRYHYAQYLEGVRAGDESAAYRTFHYLNGETVVRKVGPPTPHAPGEPPLAFGPHGATQSVEAQAAKQGFIRGFGGKLIKGAGVVGTFMMAYKIATWLDGTSGGLANADSYHLPPIAPPPNAATIAAACERTRK